MLTGEPVPVDVVPGDAVFGATLNTSGRLVVEATRVGDDTALAQIARLVEEAQGSKAPVQRLADRISAVFVPAVLVIALATLVVWLVLGHAADQAFTAAVAVLIIACPCALGLATPTAIMVGTGRGAQLGIVIKGGEVLEATQVVDVAVLDKTGTITEGRMQVADGRARARHRRGGTAPARGIGRGRVRAPDRTSGGRRGARPRRRPRGAGSSSRATPATGSRRRSTASWCASVARRTSALCPEGWAVPPATTAPWSTRDGAASCAACSSSPTR